MALTPQGRELTEAHKLAQIELATIAIGESKQILDGLLDPFRLDATREEWLGFQLDSAERYHDASSQLAGGYLNAYRAIEGEVDDLVMAEFDAISAATSADTMVVARAKQLTGEVGPRQALTDAWGWYAGALMQQVLAGGRNTIIDSVESSRLSLGWRRVTDGNPCAFCAMLATRGPAYTSAESAGHVTGVNLSGKDYALMDRLGGRTPERRALIAKGRASRKGLKRPLGAKFHDRCGCTVEEVFGEWVPTAREREFMDLYQAATRERGASTPKEILADMRANGGGILNDASGGAAAGTGRTGGGGSKPHKPKTQAGGSDGGRRKPPKPPARGFSDDEERLAAYLRSQGHQVVPNQTVNENGRHADSLVDGEKAEFKTLMEEDGPATSGTIRNIVTASKRRGGQASQLIIDARGTSLSAEEALRGIRRGLGLDTIVARIRIVGDSYDIEEGK